MSASDAPATLAEELRRRRTALGWTLEQVAQQAQVSVGMLSLIETGKRRPSLKSWGRIRGALGITEPLPEEGPRPVGARSSVPLRRRPEGPARRTPEQAEVLAVVISDGMATRRRIEEVRGATRLSIGADGPVSLPRDSSETLALLLSRGLLCAERDDHAMGRPLVYRPTPRLLQLLGQPSQRKPDCGDRDASRGGELSQAGLPHRS
jgi:transcriptional regulator with XRE-family HTH domain